MNFLTEYYRGGRKAVRDLNAARQQRDDAMAVLILVPSTERARCASGLLFTIASESQGELQRLAHKASMAASLLADAIEAENLKNT